MQSLTAYFQGRSNNGEKWFKLPAMQQDRATLKYDIEKSYPNKIAQSFKTEQLQA